MKSLLVREVRLVNVRNYADATFAFGDKFNLVTGLNGVGKTNLLDAVYYLGVGKSYFTTQDQRVVSQGADFFRMDGVVEKDGKSTTVTIKVRPGQSKEILRNGLPFARVSEHLGFLPVVFSAPRDIEIVSGTGQVRRRYVDQLLCQTEPEYLSALQAYNHLLALRNAALKQGYASAGPILDTYDEQMAPHAALIHARRSAFVGSILPSLRETYAYLSDDAEPVTIGYESQLDEYPYAVLADRARGQDLATQRSNTGIHKDDFLLAIRSMPAREFGSQGQIKSLIFALHLSKYALMRDQTGYCPLLLLDDIFDKLDERRLRRLMEILTAREFGQVFISDTSSERVASMLSAFPVHHLPMKHDAVT